MTPEEKLAEIIKGLMPVAGPSIIQGEVTEVDEFTCTVKLTANDLEIPDVQFSATEESKNGFITVPSKGSNCLLGLIGGDESSLYLVSADEIAEVRFLIAGKTIFKVDKDCFTADMTTGKIDLKNDSYDMKTLVLDILDMVSTLTVSTAMGASLTPLPPTLLKIATIEAKTKLLLK